jgi:hypothetical protein
MAGPKFDARAAVDRILKWPDSGGNDDHGRGGGGGGGDSAGGGSGSSSGGKPHITGGSHVGGDSFHGHGTHNSDHGADEHDGSHAGKIAHEMRNSMKNTLGHQTSAIKGHGDGSFSFQHVVPAHSLDRKGNKVDPSSRRAVEHKPATLMTRHVSEAGHLSVTNHSKPGTNHDGHPGSIAAAGGSIHDMPRSSDGGGGSKPRKPRGGKSSDSMFGQFAKQGCKFFKVDDEHGIAFGWAIISTINGEPYFDTQGDHIPMSACIKAAEGFMKNSRAGDEQHDERRAGDIPFALPVTADVAKSLFGVDLNQEGLVIGFKPYDKALLGKIKSGERRGFSIGGVLRAAKSTKRALGAFAKSYEDTQGHRRIFEEFDIDFISAVDWPAQEGALVTIVKSLDGKDERETVLWTRKGMLPPGQKPQSQAQQPPAPMSAPMMPMAQPAIGANALMGPPSPNGGSLPIPQPKLTGESDGHQHAILTDEVGENGVGYTGFGISSTGISHRHAFVMHPGGMIEIGVNDGHTHNADGSPSDMGDEPELDEDGNPIEPELDEDGNPIESDDADTGEDVPAFGSDEAKDEFGGEGPLGSDDNSDEPTDEKKPSPFSSKKRRVHFTGQNFQTGLASDVKENAMDPQAQIVSLKKQLAAALTLAELTDAQKAHYTSLSKRDQDAFLGMTAADRDGQIKKAADADPVVYTCDDGTAIRKSQGSLIERLARQNDENANALKKQKTEAEKLRFEKRASDTMSALPKANTIGWRIIKALEAEFSGKDDGESLKDAMALLKSGNDAVAKRFGRVGKNVDRDADTATDDPESELDTLAKKYAKENKISFHKAYDAVLKTDEGMALYEAMNDDQGMGRPDLDEYEDDDDVHVGGGSDAGDGGEVETH